MCIRDSSWYNAQYKLNDHAKLPQLVQLTKNQSGSVFAEASNRAIRSSLLSSEAVGAVVENATQHLTQDWEQLMDADAGGLADQLYQVSRLIVARHQFRAERDVFYVDLGGFDVHNNVIDGMEARCGMIDNPLRVFVEEMKAQGVWDDVVVQTVSDFARTLVFNGKGTDHSCGITRERTRTACCLVVNAKVLLTTISGVRVCVRRWGGNMFTFGGKVKGAQMFGDFPSLDLQSDLIIDPRRGSLIPTTPWEGMWKALASWFGVEDEHLHEIMPNLANFPPSVLRSVEEMFHP